jgi:hypothetical protein
MPEGTSLYVRRFSQERHGTPKQFAMLCADHNLGWIAIGGMWQDVSKTGRPTSKWINKPDVIARYADALEKRGIETWVWGYPWQDREEQFVEGMAGAAGHGRVLLDPELGANPTRSRKGAGKAKANAHAAKLVKLFAEEGALESLGLSTFGSGYRLAWFPLVAFTKALGKHYGGRTFIGGQTYTVGEGAVDLSIADMSKCITKAGYAVQQPGDLPTSSSIEIVPNFGTYARDKIPGSKKTKVRKKTPAELRAHLYGFINDDEPIDALIGWAENFMTPKLWDELARFAALMERGACKL